MKLSFVCAEPSFVRAMIQIFVIVSDASVMPKYVRRSPMVSWNVLAAIRLNLFASRFWVHSVLTCDQLLGDKLVYTPMWA